METDHTTAYIGLGSNLGDRAGNLLLAVRGLLEASLVVQRLSAIYETEPIDLDTDRKFLNMAVEVRVADISPTQMMARLLRIEYLLNRKDKSIKTSRTIDLDILTYGNLIMDTPFLTLPHPRLHLRKFVLCPLAEIAPNLVHPQSRREIADILSSVDDQSDVRRWDPNQAVDREPAANGRLNQAEKLDL
ncbi:MAG: 2-amino-4-hydroxy-6-hydroxymethyldihydropteridine diphosphokinase [Pyrinomonadaceae bacterium]|nr:2-amino-4-hydroxy-6-hydroxymethyldihydropteridine diphosphokinase [Pyrinomonadaceae bacterium]